MNQLNDMLVFAEVLDKGGFTAAAESLGIPKSNVSRKVTRLEQNLNVKLLERSTRRQRLTEIGKIYYQHCVRIREEMISANEAVENMLVTPRGKLRVCASVSVGQGLLSRFIPGFSQAFPQVEIDLRLTNRRVDMIEEGFDVAVRVGAVSRLKYCIAALVLTKITIVRFTGLFAVGENIASTPSELAAQHCLFMNAVTENARWILYRDTQTESIKLNPSFCCDDFQLLAQMTVAGLGVSAASRISMCSGVTARSVSKGAGGLD